MTLAQRISDLIGRWDGSTAERRRERREQLIDDILSAVGHREIPADYGEPLRVGANHERH